AQVVNAENVVSVGMGIENRIQMTDVFPDGLSAKVRSGINQDCFAGIFNEHGRPGALVMRIGRLTYGAIAADCGHAHRSAASEHGKAGLHHFTLLPAGWGGRARALVTST